MPTRVLVTVTIAFGLLSPHGLGQVAEPPTPPPPAANPYAATAESIWPGIVRFYPSAEDKSKAPPSLIVQIPPSRFGPPPENPPIVPKFSKDGDRHIATIEIEPGTSLYGAGVVPGPLTLNGRTFIAAPADRDVAPPAENAASLAMPWVLAVRANGTAFGVLADTTWRTEIDLTTNIVFRADGPTLPIVIVDAATPMEPVQALSQIAGWQEIPPRWALGLHRGPTPFVPEADLGEALGGIVASWRQQAMPVDSIGLYWTHMGAGEDQVAPLRNIVSRLSDHHVHCWVMLQSGLSNADAPSLFDEGGASGYWVVGANGEPVEFASRFYPDLSREATRQWWSRLYTPLLSARFDGMAFHHEAAWSRAAGVLRIPDDARAAADPDLGGPAPHAKIRAIHDALEARTAKDAMRSAFPGRRPLVQIGSPSVISQRYGYTFVRLASGTGVAAAIPALLNASMSGQAMIGIEIPAGNREGDGTDLARNLACAALLPLVRLDVADRTFVEPWWFSPGVEGTCRQALERRYRLIPYFYTLVLDAYRSGQPMMRPYFMGDPANAALRDVTDTFLLGQDLAVRVLPAEGEGRPDSIPAGWRKFDFGEDSELLPELYLRPGAILPVGPVMQYTGEKPLDPLTLIVAPDAEGRAYGTLYEDAGDGFGYLQGECRMAHYAAETKDGEIIVKMPRLDGGMGMAKRKLTVRVLLPDGREATTDYWDGLDAHVKLP